MNGCGMEADTPLRLCKQVLRRSRSEQPGQKLKNVQEANSPKLNFLFALFAK
jgi:hypothetical protein